MLTQTLRSFTVLCVIVYAGGCSHQAPLPISVAVNPQSTAIATGQSTQFTATVTNDTTGVTWSATAGTIDSTGNYTAPPGPQSTIATITATSKKGTTKSASAAVNVVAPGQVSATHNVQVAHFLISYSGQPDGNNFAMQAVDLGGNVIWQMTSAQLDQALAAATCAGYNITVIGAHHDFVMLPNGHLILIASTTQIVSGTTVTGDVLIDVGDMDQNLVPQPVWVWNEFDHLDITRQPYLYPDWTHTNAILYSSSDGNLIISIRHQNWLVKIDYNNGTGTGNILWHLGYQGDFTLLNADGSTDSNATDWFYAQHSPSFVTSNTSGKFSLILFDNGDDRGVSIVAGGTCGVAGQPACYSTVPLLELDETAMTATLAFHPTTPDYSVFGGNAEVLKNGNVEYDECASTPFPANNAKILEVTQASPPQTVWQMQIAGQFAYRGFRLPSLYPEVQW
jgi:arylsulfate sulfotransferase